MTTSRKEGGKVKMNGDLPVEVNAVSHKNGNSFLTFSVRYFSDCGLISSISLDNVFGDRRDIFVLQ